MNFNRTPVDFSIPSKREKKQRSIFSCRSRATIDFFLVNDHDTRHLLSIQSADGFAFLMLKNWVMQLLACIEPLFMKNTTCMIGLSNRPTLIWIQLNMCAFISLPLKSVFKIAHFYLSMMTFCWFAFRSNVYVIVNIRWCHLKTLFMILMSNAAAAKYTLAYYVQKAGSNFSKM